MDDIKYIFNQIGELINFPLFTQGKSNFTFGKLFYTILGVWLVFVLSKFFVRFVVEKMLVRFGTHKNAAHSIGIVIRYLIVFIGLVIIVQTAGVDLSALSILAGALGVGIGFGLQNITNNFISGIIILLERPIKIGDRVELPEISVSGNVIGIMARSTTVLTNDNIVIIVPNSKFISDTVINWSYNDTSVRFKIPVGVAYKEDPEKVKKLLLEVADEEPGVLKDPAPDVLFEGFGDSSLDFFLRFYTSTHSDLPRVIRSKLLFSIFKKFKDNDVEIPFPQRDVHIKSNQ
jgi:small-conductance mechanosensitive channel